MGLCEALARSYHSNIARGKKLQGPISFQGGVAANKAMVVAAFEKILDKKVKLRNEHNRKLSKDKKRNTR